MLKICQNDDKGWERPGLDRMGQIIVNKLNIITISDIIHSLSHLINACPTPAKGSAATSSICHPGKHHVAFHSM